MDGQMDGWMHGWTDGWMANFNESKQLFLRCDIIKYQELCLEPLVCVS